MLQPAVLFMPWQSHLRRTASCKKAIEGYREDHHTTNQSSSSSARMSPETFLGRKMICIRKRSAQPDSGGCQVWKSRPNRLQPTTHACHFSETSNRGNRPRLSTSPMALFLAFCRCDPADHLVFSSLGRPSRALATLYRDRTPFFHDAPLDEKVYRGE